MRGSATNILPAMRLGRKPHGAAGGEGHIAAMLAAGEASVKVGERHHDSGGMVVRRGRLPGRIPVLQHAHIVIFPEGAIKFGV